MKDRIIDSMSCTDEWQLTKKTVSRIERYISNGHVEQERYVNYTLFEGLMLTHKGEKTHQTHFYITEGDNPKAVVKDALNNLDRSVSNHWSLPKSSSYETVKLLDVDALKTGSLDKLENDIEQGIARFKRYVTYASGELFSSVTSVEIENSFGLCASRQYSNFSAYINLVNDKGRSSDIETVVKKPFLKEMNLNLVLPDYAVFAIESGDAISPPEGIFDVIFMGEALDTLFSYFIANATGKSMFEKWSNFKLEKSVAEGADNLTMESVPLMPGFAGTSPFDENGLALKNHVIIKNGIFKQIAASKRYSDFLSIEPIGDIRCIRIEQGKESMSSLYSGRFLELLRFSTFEPNPVTGEFSSEIRTGYFVDNGKSYPIRGGTITGKISECFKNAAFSSNITKRANYIGPKGIKVSGIQVS